MDAAPDEYQAIVNTEQRAKGDEITLQDLAETMDQQWRSLYGQRKTKLIAGGDRNNTEVALAAFAGKCHNCHQVGHRAAVCPHKKNTSKSNKKQAQTMQPLWQNGTHRGKLLELTRELQQVPEMVQTTTYEW